MSEEDLAILPKTKERIKGYLEAFIENKINEFKKREFSNFETPESYLEQDSSGGNLKPFHAAIIPIQILRINAFERGFSTTIGTTFEECARLIGKDHHAIAERGYDLSGNVSRSASNAIDHQVESYEHIQSTGAIKPTLQEMINMVFQSMRSDDLILLRVRTDLYIKTQEGNEYYFEVKSPKPNKGQCLEVLQRILRFHLITRNRPPEVKGYFAMAYNPYGNTRESYNWSMATNYLPFNDVVLIGQEFWTIIGGPTTYNELLSIYQEVGRVKAKFIIESLAEGL